MRPKRIIGYGALAFVVCSIAAGVGFWFFGHAGSSPVPKKVAQSVDFPVYYPNQAKLPHGYTLNTDSFANPLNAGVQYSVNYGKGSQLVFTVQRKPSQEELKTFIANYIPLKIDYQTHLGQAAIGAYHSQTLVSLPVNDGPWVVVTAPLNIKQNDLKQVLQSLTK